MENKIFIQPGDPNDENRIYLPEEIKTSHMVVNENGNNSQVYPERLKEFHGIMPESEETWYEYVPESYNPEKKTPLVVSFHGGLMTGWGQAIYTSWTHVADREGFIVVFPNANKDRAWTLEYAPKKKKIISEGMEGLFGIQTPDGPLKDFHDMKFIFSLIDHICEKYNIDKGRIYIQGMSMGNAVSSQLARHFGYMFAGAAGSGCPTDTDLLYKEDGTIINEGGPLDIMISRLEHDKVPPYYADNKTVLMENLRYWKTVNGCDTDPEISIRGDYNFAFYNGTKARFTIMDVKNRDHGQTFDDAERVWDYDFSGVSRDAEGNLIHSETEKERKGDTFAIAAADHAEKVWVNNKAVPLSGEAFTWQKLKYHGLNGKVIVRGTYLYLPIKDLASIFNAVCEEEEDDGKVARCTLPEGYTLQFARGSIGCVIDNQVEAMLCEAVWKDGILYIPMEWFCERFYNMHVSECDGVTYATDHPARISTYVSWILNGILGGKEG